MGNIKNIFYIIPILFYYLIESMFLGLIIFAIWKIGFQWRFAFRLSYLDWVMIVWVCKMIFFDIFKLSSTFAPTNNQNKEQK
jgi:hypothetical protein